MNTLEKTRSIRVLLIILLVTVFLAGFYTGLNYSSITPITPSQYTVRVATTTSLYQIGLLEELFNNFNNTTGLNIKFEVLVRGSGETLRLLADGSACIGFTHAPTLELQYIEKGLIERLAFFAYNEFVVVGPVNDPANISSVENVFEAFKRIYIAGEQGLAVFVSRGDYSGTHIREIQLWNTTGLNPEGRKWYLKTGQGMIQALLIAENLGNAYTLTDIATYSKLKSEGKLVNLVVLKTDPVNLVNVYSMYLSKTPSCDNPYTWYIAYKFRDYLISRGQELIASRFNGLLNPVRGREELVGEIWKALTKL